MKKIWLWIRICRPQTLFASLCPVLVGLMVGGVTNNLIAILTVICALALQILANLINDYYDYRRGSDKAGRAGFKRALAEGEVTERQMIYAIGICLAAVVITGLALAWHGNWPILLIGLSAILFAWLYTATNKSLSYLGIADIFVWLYYGVIATMGTIFLQTGEWHGFWAGSCCGLISMCVLIINNLRDYEDDKRAGKKTFPVRFGMTAGRIGMLLIIMCVPACAYMAFGLNWPMLVVIPLGILFVTVCRAQGKQYNLCLLEAGICNVIFTALVALALL